MNVTIRAMCPTCGPTSLKVADVTVTVYQPSGGSYRFVCPTCAALIDRDTNDTIVSLLIGEGCFYKLANHPFLERDLEELRAWMDSDDEQKWELLADS